MRENQTADLSTSVKTALHMDEEGQPIGIVTSGSYSPSLHKPIAMGYVLSKFAKPGLQIFANVRGKQLASKTTKLPFIPTRYFKKLECNNWNLKDQFNE